MSELWMTRVLHRTKRWKLWRGKGVRGFRIVAPRSSRELARHAGHELDVGDGREKESGDVSVDRSGSAARPSIACARSIPILP